MASQDIGGLGPRDGEAVVVDWPVLDSLRGAILWFVLLGLLLRKPNRTLHAWAVVLIPLAIVGAILGFAERSLNNFFAFNLHQYLCSMTCDLLRVFALSVAVYLAACDLMTIANRLLRFLLRYLFIFFVAGISISRSDWPIGTPHIILLVFGLLLAVMLIGHAVVAFLLRMAARGRSVGWWYAGFCVVFGLAPLLTCGIIEWRWDGVGQLQSTLEVLRIWILASAAFCLPYFALFWFAVPALFHPVYAGRWEKAFGIELR